MPEINQFLTRSVSGTSANNVSDCRLSIRYQNSINACQACHFPFTFTIYNSHASTMVCRLSTSPIFFRLISFPFRNRCTQNLWLSNRGRCCDECISDTLYRISRTHKSSIHADTRFAQPQMPADVIKYQLICARTRHVYPDGGRQIRTAILKP